MATVSYTKAAQSAAPKQAPAPEPAPEPAPQANPGPAPSTAVATMSQSPQLQGEFTARDMAIPYLQLGQKAGTLCDDHPEWLGKWVYDKALCLGEEINIIVCRLKKRYEEVTEYGGGDIPQQWDTEAAAKAANVEFRDICEIDLLVEVTSEDGEQFAMLDDAGKSYAPARYNVRSTALGKTMGVLLKDLAGWLKNDLASGVYSMEAVKVTAKGNTWYTPKLTADGKVSDTLRALIREKLAV